MGKLQMASVEVQDMLCAQALAVVAQAVERLPSGAVLEIHYNAEDVRRDLTAWAAERGYDVQDVGLERLSLTKR